MLVQLFHPAGNRPDGIGNWIGAVVSVVFGVLIALGGTYMLWRIMTLFSFRVRIYKLGFAVLDQGEETIFAYDEILKVQEAIVHEHLPIVKGPAKRLMPTRTAAFYSVTRRDGVVFSFDENLMPHISWLAGPLKMAAAEHQFDWYRTEEIG
ncbi:hypothetical protein [Anatilimnocola floriformis]|uniref:hypothetical protein n=1 Tax=Anatilimnocola floriformis TaxID=2948575 RepID=UPI0020C208B7|nr:hypothetical protein [Anatilimnocola floriformis]